LSVTRVTPSMVSLSFKVKLGISNWSETEGRAVAFQFLSEPGESHERSFVVNDDDRSS